MDHIVEQDGFAIIPGVLSSADRRQILSVLGDLPIPGRRGLLSGPAIAALSRSPRLLDLARPHLPAEPRPVRALFFDKTADVNWLVPWHQDLTIAVRERAEAPGFGPWSMKAGIPHVQPPVELLEGMLSIRLHLDDADASNGALRVLPGSHRMGRLSSQRIQELRGQMPEILCRVAAGDALLMRPLRLHASGRSTGGRHRRVLHIEYAALELPGGLEWDGAS